MFSRTFILVVQTDNNHFKTNIDDTIDKKYNNIIKI